MTTKEKILAAALQLFNEKGYESVTTRHVAGAAGMSHGNLCYHFARREELVKGLFNQLVQELDAEIGQTQQNQLTLTQLLLSLYRTYRVQLKYKFLLLDFVKILREIPEIQQHFREIFSRRKQEMAFVLQTLQAQKILKPEPIPGHYNQLLLQFYALSDFWISEAELLYEGPETEKPAFYARLVFDLLVPHFTSQGLKAYEVAITHLQTKTKVE